MVTPMKGEEERDPALRSSATVLQLFLGYSAPSVSLPCRPDSSLLHSFSFPCTNQ